MELKEGMYVRVKGKNNFPGGIAKILKIEEIKKNKWLILDKALDYSFLTPIAGVIKARHKITDLIEFGDIICWNYGNCSGINEVIDRFGEKCVHFIDDTYLELEEVEIKQTLTKEQFEQKSYKVGEE